MSLLLFSIAPFWGLREGPSVWEDSLIRLREFVCTSRGIPWRTLDFSFPAVSKFHCLNSCHGKKPVYLQVKRDGDPYQESPRLLVCSVPFSDTHLICNSFHLRRDSGFWEEVKVVSGERREDGIKNDPYSWEVHLYPPDPPLPSMWFFDS